MGILEFLGMVVYAAESIISPLPDTALFAPKPIPVVQEGTTRPTLSLFEIAMQHVDVIPTPTATPSTEKKIATRVARKNSYVVSIIGDSMVDTLGPDGGGLDKKLHAIYPNATFTIKNHGVGATNIDYGLERLVNGYTYLGENRPSVISQKPDVLIIESFAYNPYPFAEGAIGKHWIQLADMVKTVRSSLPNTKIVIAATITPNWDVFGDGAPFINMSPQGKREKVETIKQYLDSTIAFAHGEGLPLADAHTPSMDATGNGKPGLINPGDHIHYSVEGREFMATILAATIRDNKLLE
jgi:hypothetical protein